MRKSNKTPDKLEEFNLKFEKIKKELDANHVKRMSIWEGKPHDCKVYGH